MKKITIILFLLGIFLLGNAQTKGPFQFTIVKNLEATDVKSQGNTGTCWSFSASSFIESEILRKTGKKVDLSEMYVVRKIYLEKAILYIRYDGKANFSQGALAHNLFYVMKTYGMMPEEVYNGKNNAESHNHSELEIILKQYLDSVLSKKPIEPHWKEGFESILDKYLGVCPALFKYNNISFNAMKFAATLSINPDDYLGFTSFTHHSYYKPFSVEVPDNYSRGQYMNVPMDQLIEIIHTSIDRGYTVEWDGDVSEPGFARKGGAAVLLKKGETIGDTLPVEDAPTQELRQATFDSHETTDDHLMHITGIAKDQKGKRYYITKNSWGNTSGIEGYVYISENYLKLKTITIFVHKDAIPALIKSFIETN
ncbi:MAG: C1 family peptidase [Bacteroidia bacterium]